MSSARQRELPERVVVRICKGVLPRCREVAVHGIEVEFHIDVHHVGLRRVLPRREVLTPVVVSLLLGGVRAFAARNHDAQARGQHGGNDGKWRQPQRGAPKRSRSQPMDDADGVRVAPRFEAHGQDHEKCSEREHQQSIQDERGPVELERSHIAPSHGVPQIPIEDPVHLVAELNPPGEGQGEQPDPVGRVAIARDRDNRHHEAGPDQKRRDEQQPPRDHER